MSGKTTVLGEVRLLENLWQMKLTKLHVILSGINLRENNNLSFGQADRQKQSDKLEENQKYQSGHEPGFSY